MKNLSSRTNGFTIVELLIVVVVIGILAAITVVSFNGVTNRANAASAETAASNAIKKAQAYNAEVGSFPTAPSQLTSTAAQSTVYGLTGVSFAATNVTTAPSTAQGPSYLKFFTCTGTEGVQVAYWDYELTAANKWTTVTAGVCTTPAFVAG